MLYYVLCIWTFNAGGIWNQYHHNKDKKGEQKLPWIMGLHSALKGDGHEDTSICGIMCFAIGLSP